MRHGAGEAPRERRLTTFLYPLRDDLLDRARLQPGDTVLDVGTGDGLIAFGALERVGPTGRVIFSDISPDLLDRCREAVAAEGLLGRCDFRQASADSLAGVEDASVDVVTTRSVLSYVKDKAAALREFHRVLRPGGRAVLVEPVSQLQAEPGWFFGYDVRPVAGIAAKVRLFYAGLQAQTRGPEPGFDDRDLVRLAERAGFREIACQLRVNVQAARPPCPWGRFLRASPGPQLPPFGEVLDHLLDPAEAATFAGYLRPLVESGAGHRRQALAWPPPRTRPAGGPPGACASAGGGADPPFAGCHHRVTQEIRCPPGICSDTNLFRIDSADRKDATAGPGAASPGALT